MIYVFENTGFMFQACPYPLKSLFQFGEGDPRSSNTQSGGFYSQATHSLRFPLKTVITYPDQSMMFQGANATYSSSRDDHDQVAIHVRESSRVTTYAVQDPNLSRFSY
ncbi:hypothetical protein [Deinococcus maricopensis]|uniref:hypothetical protein n=1 Tax=Deinococcus maricopensis TaxID=309887 RepID=UPI0011D1E58E|nr:hypothetical protein [Deinococcus maricopensis]